MHTIHLNKAQQNGLAAWLVGPLWDTGCATVLPRDQFNSEPYGHQRVRLFPTE